MIFPFLFYLDQRKEGREREGEQTGKMKTRNSFLPLAWALSLCAVISSKELQPMLKAKMPSPFINCQSHQVLIFIILHPMALLKCKGILTIFVIPLGKGVYFS